MSNTYFSGKKPTSAILQSSFVGRLSSLFGYRAVDKTTAKSELGKQYGLDFVRVDLDNQSYRLKNASVGNVFDSEQLSQPLSRLFRAYLDDTTFSYDDVIDRQKRLNELTFLCDNNFFARRVVELVGNEATQVASQNRLISCESPNLNFVNRVYELLSLWGITPPRIQAVFRDLEEYGEHFWTHKIGLGGIEKIMPIGVNSVVERLEFNPVHMSQYLAQRDGYLANDKNRAGKIAKLVDQLLSEAALDTSENVADYYDTKLLGYELEGQIMAPPWTVTHFRVDADAASDEFYPYGRPPLLGCLTPFKQAFSAATLQALARQMSFPVTIYSVKGTEGLGPDIAFETLNNVRQGYDNIGVSPATVGSEMYTVNTKIWVPEGLLSVDVKSAKCDIDFIEDIKMYNDHVAIAAGVPKAYLDQEYGGFGNSGVSLKEQWKPFNDHIYKLQTVFLQGLGELIRLHFAITGEFDYNTPFLLSMRFPIEEMSDDKRNARKDSLEMVSSIVELLQTSLGLEDDEALPEDVMVDILSKYSFLDPTDIQRWMRLSSYLKPVKSSNDEEGSDEDADFGFDDLGGDDGGAPDDSADALPESLNVADRKRLIERQARMKEAKRQRLKEIRSKYRETKNQIYFHFLEANHLTEFKNASKAEHSLMIEPVRENSLMYEAVKALTSGENDAGSRKRLNEGLSLSVANLTNELEMDVIGEDEIARENEVSEEIKGAIA